MCFLWSVISASAWRSWTPTSHSFATSSLRSVAPGLQGSLSSVAQPFRLHVISAVPNSESHALGNHGDTGGLLNTHPLWVLWGCLQGNLRKGGTISHSPPPHCLQLSAGPHTSRCSNAEVSPLGFGCHRPTIHLGLCAAFSPHLGK